jgi:hypothetical protein
MTCTTANLPQSLNIVFGNRRKNLDFNNFIPILNNKKNAEE